MLTVPREMVLADCTQPNARGFGMTAEIHSTPNRRLTQQWAAAFDHAGYDGIRYLVRHDPSQQNVAIALFESAGEASWPAQSPNTISAVLLTQMKNTFGIRVAADVV
jgi:hypothetical protein